MADGKEGLIVCDFDGVFNTGSPDAYYEGYYITFDAVGCELSVEDQREIIDENWGSSHKVIITKALEGHPEIDDPELVPSAIEVFEDFMEGIFPARVEAVPGSADMLGRLSARYILALNTAAPRNALINSVMPKLGIEPSWFAGGIVTADQLSSNYTKPDPYVINILRSQQNFPLDKTIMVGDSLADMESAQAAGVIPVAVTGTGNLTAMTADELDYVRYKVRSVIELEDLLPEVLGYRKALGKAGLDFLNKKNLALAK